MTTAIQQTAKRLVREEIAKSWWAGFVPGIFLQGLVARYYIVKVMNRLKK